MNTDVWMRVVCVAALMLGASGSLRAQVIDLKAIEPSCGIAYKFTGGVCQLLPDELAKLKADDKCKSAPGVELKGGKCVPTEKPPSATCGDALPDLAVKDNHCVIDRKVPRSAQGAYKGDCFIVIAKGENNPYNLVAGQRYEVRSQPEGDTGRDPILTIVEAEPRVPFGPSYFCSPTGKVAREVPASEFERIGAERLGWTYGMLTLPFKYYPGDKTFKPAGALGPYVGRRSGAAGSAVTYAATAAVGTVQGEATDAQGNTTTPSLFAVSLAMGWMFDISKSPGAKPFKMGLFVGKDFVGADNAAKYPHNRKTWLAFQIGFDFTDN